MRPQSVSLREKIADNVRDNQDSVARSPLNYQGEAIGIHKPAMASNFRAYARDAVSEYSQQENNS